MLKNAENLKVGSIVFVAHHRWLSWLIRVFLGFKFSHVAYYLGMGYVLESDAGGVQLNNISNYLDGDVFYGEVVDNPLPADSVSLMSRAMLQHLEDKYDYTLLAGSALAQLSLVSQRSWLQRLVNRSDSWICSELIAEGFRAAGVKLPKQPAAMTPKDIYKLLAEELRYD